MPKMPTINTETVANQTELLASVKELLLNHELATGAVNYVFVPHASYKTLLHQELVDSQAEVGSRIVTFDEWIEDRWELFGDGRVLVSPFIRLLLLTEVVAGRLGHKATDGMVTLLEKLIGQAYVDLLERAQDPQWSVSLTPEQSEILECLFAYQQELVRQNLCEMNEALYLLAKSSPCPSLVICVSDEQLSFSQRCFLENLANEAHVVSFVNACTQASLLDARNEELTCLLNHLFKNNEKPLEPHGAIEFLLPLGRYATPVLMAQSIVRAVTLARGEDKAVKGLLHEHPPVCVSMKNPRQLYDHLASVLYDQGISSQLSDSVTVAQTALGQALGNLVELFYGTGNISDAIPTDYLLGGFSGVSPAKAHELNAQWRQNRVLTISQICLDLKNASAVSEQIVACFEQKDWRGLCDFVENSLKQRSDQTDSWVTLQQKVITRVRLFIETCLMLGRQPENYWDLLNRCKIPYTIQTNLVDSNEQSVADVAFTTLEQTAQAAECTYASLIVGDLSASQYPVRIREDSADVLLCIFGLSAERDALTEARRNFFQALSSARNTLTFERVLFDEASDEAYPAVMFEEVVDCYRSSDAFDVSINKQTGLPLILDAVTYMQPEEEVYKQLELFTLEDKDSALKRCMQPQRSWLYASRKTPHVQNVDLVVLPRVHSDSKDEHVGVLPCLSASALESYLECPYKWFTSRRLGLDGIDADFGPQEIGTFAHELFKLFYETFQESGHARVTPENLSIAQELLDELFEQQIAHEVSKDPHERPLIARSEVERLELYDLKTKLLSSLERQSRLLPGFQPRYFECAFGMRGIEPVEYAGCMLRGSIDRIDINDAGQAVIIDYKSSIGSAYQLSAGSRVWQACDLVLPNKIQSLVYAQIARRALNLDVVGALYLSFGNAKKDADSLAGAFDHRVLGPVDLLGLSADKAAVPGEALSEYDIQSFNELLDYVEATIEKAVQSMLQGEISPHLRAQHDKVCTYCPVMSCELRDER